MKLYDVAVVQSMAALHGLTVVHALSPQARELQVVGQLLVHLAGAFLWLGEPPLDVALQVVLASLYFFSAAK